MTYIKIYMGYLWDIYGITSYDVPEGLCCETDVSACSRGNNGLSSLLCTAQAPITGIRRCAARSHSCRPHACVECHSAWIHSTLAGSCLAGNLSLSCKLSPIPIRSVSLVGRHCSTGWSLRYGTRATFGPALLSV